MVRRKTEEMMAKEDVLRQIGLVLRRTALLYHHFAKTLVDELGEERGMALMGKAVEAYGSQIGREARRKADTRSLAPTPENLESDLPMFAWEMEEVSVDGEDRVRIHRCPLAEEWLQLGDKKRARLYCFVDQAKMRAFNPDYEYVHTKNVLDGDPYCELVVRQVKRG